MPKLLNKVVSMYLLTNLLQRCEGGRERKSMVDHNTASEEKPGPAGSLCFHTSQISMHKCIRLILYSVTDTKASGGEEIWGSTPPLQLSQQVDL